MSAAFVRDGWGQLFNVKNLGTKQVQKFNLKNVKIAYLSVIQLFIKNSVGGASTTCQQPKAPAYILIIWDSRLLIWEQLTSKYGIADF